MTFDFDIHLKPAKGQSVSLGGPFVQGPAGTRFVYICIGSYAGQAAQMWSGRLKVPLFEADFSESMSNETEYFWTCTVPGQTKEGKPVYATVKPFGGWSKHLRDF